MQLNDFFKRAIDSYDYPTLLNIWRFQKIDNDFFCGETGSYLKDRFFKLREGFTDSELSSISASVGHEEMNPINMKLVSKMLTDYKARKIKFRDLDVNSQRSMIHYMSVDGATWAYNHPAFEDWSWGEGTPYKSAMRKEMLSDIDKFLPRFVKYFGMIKFYYVEIPTQELFFNIKLTHLNSYLYLVQKGVSVSEFYLKLLEPF